ncbi:MAG: saccharopine dehydrogenase [Saprospiraceae bacterium]|nr:saccharopine dehydrogenase [Saprospiraceae bacterium]
MLAEMRDMPCEIFIGDIDHELAASVARWIQDGASGLVQVEPFYLNSTDLNSQVDYILSAAEIILDCLPGGQAPAMAALALKYKLHYINLTEYVAETQQITRMCEDADTGFVLQAGLAPGFINILAHKLYNSFVAEHQNEKVEKISMKVGALTRVVKAPHYYGFTWSPIGVATEYLKDTVAIRGGEKVNIPALSGTTEMMIDGLCYEDDFTSGGAADLPDFFLGKTKELDYKTIRYPGHFNWVRQQIATIDHKDPRPEYSLLELMQKSIPHVEDDLIVIYASVEGYDRKGILRIKEKSMIIHPKMVGSHKLKAIQITTAAPMLECARMLLTGNYKGSVPQSSIDPEEFMKGPFVQMAFFNSKNQSLINS